MADSLFNSPAVPGFQLYMLTNPVGWALAHAVYFMLFINIHFFNFFSHLIPSIFGIFMLIYISMVC